MVLIRPPKLNPPMVWTIVRNISSIRRRELLFFTELAVGGGEAILMSADRTLSPGCSQLHRPPQERADPLLTGSSSIINGAELAGRPPPPLPSAPPPPVGPLPRIADQTGPGGRRGGRHDALRTRWILLHRIE